jgi:HAMP domain-containing protein
MLEWFKVLVPTLLSWPVVGLAIVLMFRKSILDLFERFSMSSGSKAEIGPLKIELGKLAEEGKDAVGRLNRTTELMAESRLLELEITSGMFGAVFSEEQQARLEKQIEELRALTSAHEQSALKEK